MLILFFWNFQQYQLIEEIESSEKYTIFVPGNSSVEKYCQEFNITQLVSSVYVVVVVVGDIAGWEIVCMVEAPFFRHSCDQNWTYVYL